MHRVLLPVVAAFAFAGATAQAQDGKPAAGFDLGVKAAPGAEARYVMHVKTARRSRHPRMATEQVQGSEWSQEIVLKALERRPDGLLPVEAAFERMRIDTYHPFFGAITFDSLTPPSPQTANPLHAVSLGNMLGFLKAKLVVVLHPDGSIADVEGVEGPRKFLSDLAGQGPAWEQYRSQFDAIAKICFAPQVLRKSLQPLFPQTKGGPAAVGERWSERTPRYLFGGIVNPPVLEWKGESALEAIDGETAVLKCGGTEIRRTPYHFPGDPPSAVAAPSISGRSAAESAPATRPFRGRTLSFVADGVGRLSLKDGLWDRLDLMLEWIDDQPEAKKEPGPGAKDEYRSDRTTYRIERVAAFAKPESR